MLFGTKTFKLEPRSQINRLNDVTVSPISVKLGFWVGCDKASNGVWWSVWRKHVYAVPTDTTGLWRPLGLKVIITRLKVIIMRFNVIIT